MKGPRPDGSARRRFAVVASALVALDAFAASCGPVAPPPSSGIVVNACPPDSCAAYEQVKGAACTGGRCASNDAFDFTLVVSPPDTSTSGAAPGGVPIAIPDFLFSYLARNSCNDTFDCARVPDVVTETGSLSVNVATQACAGRHDDGEVILPTSVELWPQWLDVPASAAGFPLLPVPAESTAASSLSASGPGGTPATQWMAIMSPATIPGTTSPLAYEEDIVPLDPNYPPIHVQRAFGSGPVTTSTQLSVDECSGGVLSPETTFTVTRGNGSLAGFTVYVRDAVTRRRVSSLATLSDAALGSVSLLTSGVLSATGWQPGWELVVAPPAGAPVPTYADTIPPVTQLGQVSFPPLPTPLTVSGTVVGPDGATPIEADLVITSTTPSSTTATGGIAICTSSDCTSTASRETQRPLSYATTAHADRVSGYSVVLPPGTYDVFIVPALGEDAGATTITLGVQPALEGVPPIAAGKTLEAAARATIAGNVMLADGRVLVGAAVEAHVAASQVATSADPAQWPRTVSALTDATGHFSISADPGTYDVVVRPVDGSGFPWVTLTSLGLNPGAVLSFAASPILVPAPIVLDMTLRDGENGPLVGAVVRAYAASPTGPLPVVQLGGWVTDGSGHFTMLFSQPE